MAFVYRWTISISQLLIDPYTYIGESICCESVDEQVVALREEHRTSDNLS